MITSNNINEIKLELSYRCNMNCMHCSSEGSKDKDVAISLDESLNILKSATNLNVKTISLSGGEPFLWPNLVELIDSCLENNFNLKLYTNGSTNNYKKILSKIKKRDLDIIFSLHGSSPNIHDNITGMEGSFNKTLSSIKYTLSNDFLSEIHFVPLRINYKELIPLTELITKVGINKISVLRFVPQGRGAEKKDFILNKKQNLELKTDILHLRKTGYSIRTGSPLNYLLLDDQPVCTSGINKIVIAPDLSLYPCDAFKQIQSDRMVGYDKYSSLKTSSLERCWRESKYLNEIRRILNSKYKEPCQSCHHINICRSGCLAQNILSDNSLKNAIDPSCLLH